MIDGLKYRQLNTRMYPNTYGKKISQMEEVDTLKGTEMIPIQYLDQNNKVSISTLKSYISTSIDVDNIKKQIQQIQEDLNAYGTSYNKPSDAKVGFRYFDTTISKPVYKTETIWVDATGENAYKVIVSANSDMLFKKGTTNDITLTWTIKQNGLEVIPEKLQINDTIIESSLKSMQYNDINTDITYTIKATKDMSTGQDTVKVQFVNPSYSGVVSKDFVVNESNVRQLTETLKVSSSFTLQNLNLNDQKILYAYPKSFGELKSIKDANNFEYLNSYSRSVLSINGEDYYIYILSTATTVKNFKQIYQ